MQRIVASVSNVIPSPSVKSFNDSHIFYEGSLPFKRQSKVIGFSGGLKCRQCGNKNKHNSQSGYCYFHKRIVDMNETCPYNTCNRYKNINMRR